MDWKEILSILVPIFALLGWIYLRIDKKFDIVDKKFDQVIEELKCIRKDLNSIDMRLSRLEGRFEERGHWEAREWRKSGTDHKK